MSKEQALQVATNPELPQAPTQTPLAPQTEEAVKPEPPVEVESTKWAALAKKEAKLVHRDLELKRLEEDLRKKITPFQEFEALKSKDPVQALRSLGFSETDIFNWLAGSEKKEPTVEEKAAAAAEEKIKAWEAEQQAKANAEDQKQNEAVLTKFRGKIKNHLASHADKYEACADYGAIAEDAAYRLIKQVAKDTEKNEGGPTILSLDEAFETLEQYYVGEYERMSKYKKFQKTQETPSSPPPETKPPPKPTKTLTNSVAPTIAAIVARRETRSEKRERLMRQLAGTTLTK